MIKNYNITRYSPRKNIFVLKKAVTDMHTNSFRTVSNHPFVAFFSSKRLMLKKCMETIVVDQELFLAEKNKKS